MTVEDEDGETVYEAPVDNNDEDGHQGYGDFLGTDFSIYDPDNKYLGQVAYTCLRNEEGSFFEGTLDIDHTFDPKRLELKIGNFNERSMIAEVVYYTKTDSDGDIDWESAIVIENEGGGDTSINDEQHELMKMER